MNVWLLVYREKLAQVNFALTYQIRFSHHLSAIVIQVQEICQTGELEKALNIKITETSMN